MRRHSPLCLIVVFWTSGALAATATGPDMPTLYHALQDNLVSFGEIDGKAITGVQDAGSCKTAFDTGTDMLVQDWTRVTNITQDHEDGTSHIRLEQPGHEPVISMRQGHRATRVMMSLGVISSGCEQSSKPVPE